MAMIAAQRGSGCPVLANYLKGPLPKLPFGIDLKYRLYRVDLRDMGKHHPNLVDKCNKIGTVHTVDFMNGFTELQCHIIFGRDSAAEQNDVMSCHSQI